jgi:phospholipid/cholesterol/gamma-HCH transport system substrate-binding protein
MALTGEENRGLVTEVLERGGSFLKNLDETLTKNAENLDRLFKALSTSAEGLSATFDEGRRAIAEARETLIAIRRAAEVVQEDAKRLGTLLQDGNLAVAEITKRVGPGELGKVTASFSQLVVRTDALIEKLDLVVTRSREDVLASMRFLTETIENMRDFSRLIREDPSRLLKGQERRERVLP